MKALGKSGFSLAGLLHQKRYSYILHRVSRRATVWLTIFVGIEAGFTKLPERPDFIWLYQFTQWQANEHGWWLILCSSALVGLFTFLQKRTGSPAVWDTLHALLCGTQTLVFPSDRFEVPNFHRVTLFRGQSYSGPRDVLGIMRGFFVERIAWLVPIVRSRHTDQITKTKFRVGDKELDCSGIAGRSWFEDRIVAIANLPDLHNNDVSEDEWKDYAKKSHVPLQDLKAMHPHARSILAVPVKVQGKLWGALVFDSRSPDPIDQGNVENLCDMLSQHLGQMIERML